MESQYFVEAIAHQQAQDIHLTKYRNKKMKLNKAKATKFGDAKASGNVRWALNSERLSACPIILLEKELKKNTYKIIFCYFLWPQQKHKLVQKSTCPLKQQKA